MDSLDMDIRYIKGVGPKRAMLLDRLGIYNLEDLFFYIPREYDDRSVFKFISDCDEGEKASFKVKVVGQEVIMRPRRNMSILKIPVTDGITSAYLTWFNQEYLKYQFKIGESYIVNGTKKRRGMEIQINNPVFEKEDEQKNVGNIVPIYDLTEGITNNLLSGLMEEAFSEYMELIDEFLPVSLINKLSLMDRKVALKHIHFPPDKDTYIRARNRISLEELLTLQLGLYIIKNSNKTEGQGIIFNKNKMAYDFIDKLPFTLTNAQFKVFEEIKKDMNTKGQMNRLVQGDVGSGKTIVALLAILIAVESGYQATMMAPTEILARQHFESISRFLKDYDLEVKLLVGSLKAKERRELLEDLESGKIDILVGTHAVIQEGVDFKKLGLVITDEQHRFGVEQRAALSEKGDDPDILVMTATPIPRTLALILYGDLDISIIDELPPGRKEIDTFAVGMDMIERVNIFIEKQLKEGRQAYIVCSLIEESEKLSIRSAEEIYEDLSKNYFKDYDLALLHGKMKSDEKDEIMESFKDGKIDILVSTTVIEVGVDVPNSNIMVIYNAERFGLAQLHQLRGRVGRGEYQSYCILLNESNNKIARERMRIMQSSSDGFVISEKDLELRGPGEFFGTKQHGLPELKVANLFRDIKILELAQKEAVSILKNDPELNASDNKGLRDKIKCKFKEIESISFN